MTIAGKSRSHNRAGSDIDRLSLWEIGNSGFFRREKNE
jgi:hypothetical protein